MTDSDKFFYGANSMSACPRCQTPLQRLDQRFCARCGLEFVCRNCHSQHADPLANEFCANCGTRVLQIPWAGSSKQVDATSSDEVISPRLERVSDLRAQIMSRIAKNRKSRPLRELYADTGLALVQQERYPEGAEALEAALKEQGDTPSRSEILLSLASTCEAANSPGRAFRAYLESCAHDSDLFRLVVPLAHELVSPEIAFDHASWLDREWAPKIEELNDQRCRADTALLLGRIRLFTGEYEKARKLFGQATEDCPETAKMAADFLTSEYLPVTLRMSDGNARFILAQLYSEIGQKERALSTINNAIELGLSDKTRYPEAPAQALKAELLEAIGDKQAAYWFYEAGRRYYWRGEYDRACDLLERAADLEPGHPSTYWQWMDSLRMNSYGEGIENEEVRELIEKSLKLWDMGVGIREPDEKDSWAYVARALVNEKSADLPQANRMELWWQSIAYLEQAILLNKDESYRWAHLGRFHRNLNKEACALEATQTALKISPDNLIALEERVGILTNIGEFEEALELIDKRRETESSSWLNAVEAYILLRTEKLPAALKLINHAVEAAPTTIWYRNLRGTCLKLLGKDDSVKEECQWIWSKHNDPKFAGRENLSYFAGAAYELGRFDEAIAIYRKMYDDPSEDAFSVRVSLMECYLAKGDLATGERHLFEALACAINLRQLDDLLRLTFKFIEKDSTAWPHGKQVSQLLERIQEKISNRRKQIVGKARSPVLELEEVIHDLKDQGPRSGWIWSGAHAGLARLYAEERRWGEAAHVYQQLKTSERFSGACAGLGLEKAFDGIQMQGDFHLHEGKPYEALARFEQAMTLLLKSLPKDKRREADLLSRSGLARFLLGNLPDALEYFGKAIQLYRHYETLSPGETMGTVCWPLLKDTSQYWEVSFGWKSYAQDVNIEVSLRAELYGARKTLAKYLDEQYKLLRKSGESAEMLPVVTPIAIEISQDLIPEGPDKDWALLQKYFPEMRQRIKEETGVNLPGVRVRGNEYGLPDETYIIMLDEVPLVSGNVRTKMCYCPVSLEKLQFLGIPDQLPEEAPHPLNGEPGCWVSRDHWEMITNKGLELWDDPLLYMVYHLEAVLRRNLADFLGIQAVENLLWDWEQAERGSSLIKEVLPDQASRFRFARVLRALVKERVSITSWEDILETVRESGLATKNESEVVRLVRLKLREYLPGNTLGSRRLPLPPETERKIAPWIWRENGKAFLSLPPEETQELLSDIRGLVDPNDKKIVLVTHDAELRPFIRRLVELEHPDLMVISQDELISEEEMMETAKLAE